MNNKKEMQPFADLNTFINKLQLEDKKIEQIYMLLKITYIVLIVIYIPIFYFEFIEGGTIAIVKISSTFLGFFTFLILSALMQKRQKALDYSIPTLQLLKNTVKRYRLFSIRDVIGVVGFSLIMFGLIINEKRYLAFQDFKESATTFCATFNSFWSALKQIEISSLSKFSSEHQFMILFSLIAFSVVLLIGSVFVGYIIWEIRYKSLRDNALELVRELEC